MSWSYNNNKLGFFATHKFTFAVPINELTTALGKVLPRRPIRMPEIAVPDPFVGIVLSIGGYGVVPCHRPNAKLCLISIVSIEVVLL